MSDDVRPGWSFPAMLILSLIHISSCVFTSPEVASVGLTEREALAREIPYTVGRYSFMASGKAAAAGERDGFVKLLFDADRKLIGRCV